MGKAVRVSSNTVHYLRKNCLTGLSSSFWILCASSKGGSWINWESKLFLLIENQLILVRPNTQVLGLLDGRVDIALPRKYNAEESQF
jgi:hypothetical protein